MTPPPAKEGKEYDDDGCDHDPDDDYCYTCNCRGFIVTCCDDLCQGDSGCIHGDGEEVCPDCKGRWL